MRRRLVPALLGLVLLPSLLHADVAVPPLRQRVTDLTATLGPQQASALEQKLAAFEQRKGSQIAVLIVPTTEPETIEQYSIRVAEAWKLGRKGVDDGALLLVAKNDRALRIEVGYGLEGVLPDARANQIVEDIIVPRFRAGDFAGGIDAGASAMIKVIDGEPLPPPQRWRSPGSNGNGVAQLLPIALVFMVVVGSVLRAVIGRLPAAAVVGFLVGGLAWLLVASLAVALVVALLAFLFTLIGGMPGAGSYGRGGGWGGGGWSPSGGGWSGGGGGFGGGGASGRW